ncbi:MAG: trypsin-like peptidase domain-containing protein [Pseudomonadota bacterium]
MRFPVGLVLAAFAAAMSSSAGADDIGAAARGVVRIIVASKDYSDPENSSVGFGSGFAISPHHIVTNAHVVEAAQNPYADTVVAIVPSEGRRALTGVVIAYDSVRDLAIIDVGDTRLEPLAIYSGPVDAGQHSAALGYPGNVDRATVESMYDLITPTAPVRAEGNVSGQRRIEGTPALLHTAPISRGNSGGPLVDECGRVLGINTYTAVTASGDSPFGFAVVSQELMSFLHEHGEHFQQVGTACISMAALAQREQQSRETAAREEAAARERGEKAQERRETLAKGMIQESRENHAVTSALLAVLAVVAGAFGSVLFFKDRERPAAAAGSVAALALAGAAFAFFSRPSLDVNLTPVTDSVSAAAVPVSGKLVCQVQPDRSRITVSSSEDLPITWEANGCMNGRTQYVQEDGLWRRVLVPNGTETVYLQEFDASKGEYVSTRYLLDQPDMTRLRDLRGNLTSKSCTADSIALHGLEKTTETLIASLPARSNEKLVYHCQPSS